MRSKAVRRLMYVKIPQHQIGTVIGPKGSVKQLIEEPYLWVTEGQEG